VNGLVVGVDAGATTTRALVADLDGNVVGTGRAAGANIRSSGADPAPRLAEALAHALRGVDASAVRAGVLGVAGAGAAGVEVVESAARQAWASVGAGGRPRVVTDLEVAFAAGSAAASGLLVLAGTGAGAAAFAERRMVRRCDGYGWLLGDEGSAVWLGLRGVRAALDAADGRGPATRLLGDLAALAGVGRGELAQHLIGQLHADAPARLGSFAPLVTAAAQDGDAVARGLVEAAADRLVAAVFAVASAVSESADLVLAGALLAGGPVREAVLAKVAGTSLRPRDAGPGAAGAAALALAEVEGSLDVGRHARLMSAATAATPA
jgi:N-acetylglucosamine kinase-like BadF-type ATPase